MKDDAGDLFRRGLWLAGGCAALGAFLVLRTVGDSSIPRWAAWFMLLLSVPIMPAAIETGRYYWDLAMQGVSLAVSLLGLFIFALGWLTGGGRGELLDLGPIFALVGFAIGTLCNGVALKDVLQDLQELSKESQNRGDADEDEEGTPMRVCPQCGRKIPVYAAACKHCKRVLIKA